MFEKFDYSKAEMQMLGFLLRRYGETHVREIAEKSGVSAATASVALRKFEKNGILRKTVKGKMVFYRQNPGSAVARQLKVFFTISNLSGIIEKLKPLSNRIMLFGSCAEGTDVEESDIDLFVLSNKKDAVRRVASANKRISLIPKFSLKIEHYN